MTNPRTAEILAALASGLLAEPVSGWAGILSGGDPKAVEKMRERLTYRPRGKGAQKDLENIGGAMEYVAEPIRKAKNWAGDKTLAATGSPALATMVHTAPDAFLTLLGAAPSVNAFAALAKGLPKGALRTALTTDIGPMIESTVPGLGAPGAAAIKWTPDQVKRFVDRAQRGGGATVLTDTGLGLTKGDRLPPGYIVASREQGLGNKSFENIAPTLDMARVSEFVNNPKMRETLDRPGAALGAWKDKNDWVLDVSHNVPKRARAANEVITTREKAAFNNLSRPKFNDKGEMTHSPIVSDPLPSFMQDRQARAMYNAQVAGVPEEAMRKTGLLATEPRPQLPNTPEFWPWNIGRGSYELSYFKDPKERGVGKYAPTRVPSADEKKLTKAIKKAEDDIKAGKLKPMIGDADVYDQPSRGETLKVPYPKKGIPAWLAADLTPEKAARFVEAYKHGVSINPLSPKWYGTGKIYDDFLRDFNGDVKKTEAAMDRLGDMMGATTTSSRPPQNVRSASFQALREKQGLPVPEEVQVPYGHKMYSGTHTAALRDIHDTGTLDPMQNPKGAHFSGNISGKTDDATLDKVMSNKAPFHDASGNVVDAPRYYGPYRDWMRDEVAPRLGVKPKEMQAAPWVGWNEAGGDPLISVIGKRIAVTSAVTGMPQKKVYDLWRKNFASKGKAGIPLLTAGGVSLGGLLAPASDD